MGRQPQLACAAERGLQPATTGPITMSAKTTNSTIKPSFASSDMQCSEQDLAAPAPRAPFDRSLPGRKHKPPGASRRVTLITEFQSASRGEVAAAAAWRLAQLPTLESALSSSRIFR